MTKPIYTKNRTIGLLGGSFNPAHSGHLHITLYALHKLKFDEVWWLVSPRNPLKSQASLAFYEKRLQSAQEVAKPYPRIRVLDIEARSSLRYSYETIAFLQAHYPGAQFVWMMGADNLVQFHRWRRWKHILATIPIAVFDRAPYSHTALRSKTMIHNRKYLLKNIDIASFNRPPGLAFIHLRRNPLSSTYLRKKLGMAAFLGHNNNAGNY